MASSNTSSPDYDESAASLIFEIFLAIRPQYAPFRLTLGTWENDIVPAEDNASQTVPYYHYEAEWTAEWTPPDLDLKILNTIFCHNQCDDVPVVLGPIISDLLGHNGSPEVLSLHMLPKSWLVTGGQPLLQADGLRRAHTVVKVGAIFYDITGGQFGVTKLRVPEEEYRREYVVSEYGDGASMTLEEAASLLLASDRPNRAYWNPLFLKLRGNLDTAFKAWMTERDLTKEQVVLDPVRRREVVELFRAATTTTRVEFNVEWYLGGLGG
ncbi:uncharacterized protein BDZ99DRAFT_479929 [Mytilinidion resinicola]|uniref:Uncharacterized protein n=1 Tax=Mytilinidion resinicola TaxID=574789 RepID=A0A6A6YDI2_9PEZI|nr:uncharacterized protein BDZ99DRAFT_479929 [Mytilinidion resinicola]KAF2805907.1 hypothetical protein BDZ99DRAFT_479929 [Mytilinidion resinicola]